MKAICPICGNKIFAEIKNIKDLMDVNIFCKTCGYEKHFETLESARKELYYGKKNCC